MKTFKDIQFEQDTRYPHEELGNPPKYNGQFSTDEITLSVVYGGGSYGDGPDSDTYEIALFVNNRDDMIHLTQYEQVAGWQNSEDIDKLMRVMQQKPDMIGNHLACLLTL